MVMDVASLLWSTAATLGARMRKLNQKGIALVITLGIGLALVVLGAVLFFLARIERGLTQETIAQTKAFWEAEAGLQKAHWWLRFTDELKEDVVDKPITILDSDGKTFIPEPGGKILVTKTTKGSDLDKGGLVIDLISKAQVPTQVRQGEKKEQVLKEQVLLTLPGSLGHHNVAIATPAQIYYVEPPGPPCSDCCHGWHDPGWYHGCCHHKYKQNTESLAQVQGDVEIGDSVTLPQKLFDSLDDFKKYFKGIRTQRMDYTGDQSFYDGILPKDDQGHDINFIFVDGDISLYGNWKDKDVTFVATGTIYLKNQKSGCCRHSSYNPVTTGDTGRLTLIAYGDIVIIGSDASNVINGVICARGNVDFKGVSTSRCKCKCGCWHRCRTDPSGGIFKGSILAKGEVRLGVNWNIYYDSHVITGDIGNSRFGLPRGFQYNLVSLSWAAQ